MKGIGACCAVIVLAVLAVGRAHAAAACEPSLGRIVSAEGEVSVQRRGQVAWQPVALEEPICAGDAVRVGSVGRAGVWMDNETVIRLDSGTTLTFLDPPEDSDGVLDLLRGAVHFLSRVSRSLQIRTPFVNAGIKGTELTIQSDSAGTRVTVLEGRVEVDNAGGMLSLSDGESAFASPGNPPGRLVLGNPRETANWALYYPPIVDFRPQALSGSDPAVISAIADYRAGRIGLAIEGLEAIPESGMRPETLALKASLLLSVGRVEVAESDLNRLDALRPDDGVAGALRSIIALTQGRPDEALDLAEAATRQTPASPVPWVALSYARQARFDHRSALAAAQEAVAVDPDNALAHARVAELHLALGQRRDAQTAAERALQLNPGLAQTQTVFGFANLAALAAARAESAFDEAIRLDPASPLPRLGLGLARIRQGQLADGRQQIEIAAGLDPANSLIRSYLGKAYFSERRAGVAAVEFANAKTLDPQDPTPWLYDALLKQSVNRPGEALQDIQESIRLNDNRALFRSKLLLDQDVAARNTSLGSIYRDLDFAQLGALEGYRSLAVDPANFSAHQLLADTYAALPRHEIARVSEQHQALILSPPSASSLQPQSAFADLAIPKSTAMRSVSLNEFGPLFSRDGVSLQVDGLIGGNDTWGNDLILSGLHQRLGYSLGQFHYETDGYRENNDLKHDILSVFANFGISAGSHVQFQYSDRETKFGDLRLRFDPRRNDPNDRRKIDEHVSRLSGYHELAPGKALVGSLSYIDRSVDTQIDKLTTFPFGVVGLADDRTTDTDGTDAEVQFISQAEAFNAVAGIRHLDLNRSANGEQVVYGLAEQPFFPFPVQTVERVHIREDNTIRDTRAYLYTGTTFAADSRVFLGFSVDDLDDPVRNDTKFNPKVGLSWQVRPRTRVRAAATRTVKLSVAANQTLEPTEVAGFNQFFDDPDGTVSKRYGIGLDHQFNDSLYAGGEMTWRDLDVPVLARDEDIDRDRDERLHNAYLYWLPRKELALRAGFMYESVDNGSKPSEFPDKVTTKTFSGGMVYTVPKGFIGSVTARRVNHEVDYPSTSGSESGDDTFWIVDASVGWRLPDRRGLVEVGVNNLFDKDFNYEDPYISDPSEPSTQPFQPDRFVFGRLTFQF